MNNYCSICCVYLSNTYKLKCHFLTDLHKKRVENKLQYVCECGKSFTKSSNLSRHRKTCNESQTCIPTKKNISPEVLLSKNKILKAENEKLKLVIRDNKKHIKALEKTINTYKNQKPIISNFTIVQQNRRKLNKNIRNEIRNNQNNKCNDCNNSLSQYYNIDHIIGLQYGGTDNFDNLQALCCECHAKKSLIENSVRNEIRNAINEIIQKNKNHSF